LTSSCKLGECSVGEQTQKRSDISISSTLGVTVDTVKVKPSPDGARKDIRNLKPCIKPLVGKIKETIGLPGKMATKRLVSETKSLILIA